VAKVHPHPVINIIKVFNKEKRSKKEILHHQIFFKEHQFANLKVVADCVVFSYQTTAKFERAKSFHI